MMPVAQLAPRPAAPVIPISEAKRSSTLFDIVDELDALFNCLEGAEALAPDELRALEADIARVLEAQVAKVDGITGYMRHLEKQMEFAKEETERLKVRRQRFERRLERIEGFCLTTLQVTGRHELVGRTSALARAKNPVSVRITADHLIPVEFMREKVERTRAIRRPVLRGNFESLLPALRVELAGHEKKRLLHRAHGDPRDASVTA